MGKIMIVDDNEDFLKELSETLFLCGYDTEAVFDSSLAYSRACISKPDVILLDLRMNKKNGFHVAEELKQSKVTKHIPIIAMSGYFPVEKDALLLDFSNMHGRIQKPFAIADLVSQIEGITPTSPRHPSA
jgi:CheY-like chemotaxis protein